MQFQLLFESWKDVQVYASESIVYNEGDPAEVLYFIISGEVNLTLRDELLGTEIAGGIIGEMAMIKSATQCATATAASEVKLARLDRKQLKQLVKSNNGFSIHVMAALAKRLKAVDHFISEQFVPGDHRTGI